MLRNKKVATPKYKLILPRRITCLTTTSQKLSFGLILLEYSDAIKAGDGGRLHDLYKIALLLFKANGKTKYSYAILMYLLQI
jgi:hypothetical protein